jgi:GH24 family phage-related lysozyme (muramidase)
MKAYKLWPNFDALNDRQKTALVSLTFNRGTSLVGSTRSEMKEVHDNLERGNTRPVAGLIKQMALRSPLKGVQLRRKQEGELFAS